MCLSSFLQHHEQESFGSSMGSVLIYVEDHGKPII